MWKLECLHIAELTPDDVRDELSNATAIVALAARVLDEMSPF